MADFRGFWASKITRFGGSKVVHIFERKKVNKFLIENVSKVLTQGTFWGEMGRYGRDATRTILCGDILPPLG